MSDNRITQEELRALFGDSIPIEVVKFLSDPPQECVTPDDVRVLLRAMVPDNRVSTDPTPAALGGWNEAIEAAPLGTTIWVRNQYGTEWLGRFVREVDGYACDGFYVYDESGYTNAGGSARPFVTIIDRAHLTEWCALRRPAGKAGE